jgi:hypothetical protein
VFPLSLYQIHRPPRLHHCSFLLSIYGQNVKMLLNKLPVSIWLWADIIFFFLFRQGTEQRSPTRLLTVQVFPIDDPFGQIYQYPYIIWVATLHLRNSTMDRPIGFFGE